jgi:hypothetical protein
MIGKPDTTKPIRSTQNADVLICPWHPGDTGTLYVFKRAARDFFMCFGCSEEGYATQQTDGGYQLRKQSFRNVLVTKNRRIAVP